MSEALKFAILETGIVFGSAMLDAIQRSGMKPQAVAKKLEWTDKKLRRVLKGDATIREVADVFWATGVAPPKFTLCPRKSP